MSEESEAGRRICRQTAMPTGRGLRVEFLSIGQIATHIESLQSACEGLPVLVLESH